MNEPTLTTLVFLLIGLALIGPLITIALGYRGLARAERLTGGGNAAMRSFGVWNAWTMGLPTAALYLDWGWPARALPQRAARLVPLAWAVSALLLASLVLAEAPPLVGGALFVAFALCAFAFVWRCGDVDEQFGPHARAQLLPIVGYGVAATALAVVAGFVVAFTSVALGVALGVAALVCWFLAYSHSVTAACLVHASLAQARSMLEVRRGGTVTAMGLGLVVLGIVLGIVVGLAL